MDDMEHLRGYDDAGWTPGDDLLLWHGTSSSILDDLTKSGVRPHSCWGTERVARYFAEGTCDDVGGTRIILGVPLAMLDRSLLRIDPAMIEFPIFPDYDGRQYEWEETSPQGWSECLRLYEAVVYGAAVPWNLLVRI